VSDLFDLEDLTLKGDIPLAVPGRDKREIRAAVLSVRRSLPPSVRAEADLAIRTALAAVVAAMRPGTVCAYVPMAGEPGGAELLSALTGTRLLLPVLRPDLDLDWAESGPLVSGRYGLREPSGPRLGIDAITGADLVIAPGVAVAGDGTRLGRGGGSYDRALARVAPATPVLVPLYEGELVASLPAEPHDRPVHGVVTPSGLRLLAHTGRNRPR
jgi:5-formyltetrahydrofolate cyclo-ligase